MFKQAIKYLLPSLLSLSFSCASQMEMPVTKTVFAIGDLHGDLDAAKKAFALAGATNQQGNWTGKNIVVVQTGDLIDRGLQDKEVMDWLNQLQSQATAFDSELHLLNGNHELMNAEGDFRYVHPENFKSLSHKDRQIAFQPGGHYAKQISQRPAIFQFEDTVFVHGGVLPEHIDYGITKINQAYRKKLSIGAALPEILTTSDSPLWTRIYSAPSQAVPCDVLQKALAQLNAKRMVVAHSVQPEINSACNQQVWRIDTGMSVAYGGTVQVLKIEADKISVLKASDPY